MEQVALALNDKFTKMFGRTIILGEGALSENMTQDLHRSVMETVPILWNLPGRSVELRHNDILYKISHIIDSKGRRYYLCRMI
jgi:hypothetical protein